MSRKVVVVESPAKAKTINRYLGKTFNVLASYGHVRDLPPKPGSVDPQKNFSMLWKDSKGSSKPLKLISDAVRNARQLILATDPDREGEAIAWHILEILKKKKLLKDVDVARVVFNAITKGAVLHAMEQPRKINMELVEAYMARRALDYLVGFTLSPLLWRKLPGARSAGRVQSVALRLLCDREDEIQAFRKQEYWSVEAQLCAEGQNFGAFLVALDGKKLGKFDLPQKTAAQNACAQVRSTTLTVLTVDKKPHKRHPAPPFITSTLQQEASRKLGFSARKTMTIAQKLYEGVDLGDESTGLITYMRTDGLQMAPEAIKTIRTQIKNAFGKDYCPNTPRVYKTKAKNAQEAHEAIRPTNVALKPDSLKSRLPRDEYRLYDLIWKRALASQMSSARLERTTMEIGNEKITLRATGSVLLFDGFLVLYQETQDDKAEEKEKRLPQLSPGRVLEAKDIDAIQHFTEPPPRYTEASLVKRLESLGIGRPSTYASILSVLREREYAHIQSKRFVCDDRGRVVTSFLCDFFPRYVEYDFTALLEEQLDRISAGELDRNTVLKEFWQGFSTNIDGVKDMPTTDVLERLNEALCAFVFTTPEGKVERSCPVCKNGTLSIKTGKYGAFVGCSDYPTCTHTRPLFSQDKPRTSSTQLLGEDPKTGKKIFFKQGPYGPYVEREDEQAKSKRKPKRMSIPASMREHPVDLDTALLLLSLPRELGQHPETGKPVTTSIGRYGPYVTHEGIFVRLSGIQEVFEVGLNRAIDLIAQKTKKRSS